MEKKKGVNDELKMNKNLTTILIAILIFAGLFFGVQIWEAYNNIHHGDVWIAELYVKTIDQNGNPVAAYIMVSEPYGTGWRVIKEKATTGTGTFEYIDLFTPTIISGKQYRIDAINDAMHLQAHSLFVTLVNGRNEITIILESGV